MSDLPRKIAEMISSNPGLKAREIADRLEVDRKLVNSALHGVLKGKVTQDSSYRWFPVAFAEAIASRKDHQAGHETPLARLCRYYLDCLSHDDLGGVSKFASSRYSSPDYVELSSLPMLDTSAENPFDSESGRRLLSGIKRDRNRQAIYLGYPVRLNLIRSKKGWEGFMVEPILLFSYQDVEGRYSKPQLSEDLPQINFKALRTLSNTGESNLMEEAVLLSDDLGLSASAEDQPEADELLVRLGNIRPEWDWQEELNPYSLSGGASLADLTSQGIYNRAILISAERSPYTKGLEAELGRLQSLDPRENALASWLAEEVIASPPADLAPLLEVLPLNSEQRQAVRQSLENQLTVITGPPGTGKSQVVTSILVNAAWQGKTVLFASKNNKAVDVVETRVNALGPRPVLLRLGSNQYQNKLAEYLAMLLAAKATSDDSSRYREYEDIHSKLQAASSELDAQLQFTIKLRNEVDQLEQSAEELRKRLSPENFAALRSLRSDQVYESSGRFLKALRSADRSGQTALSRIFWPIIRDTRLRRLAEAAVAVRGLMHAIGEPMPAGTPDNSNISTWIDYGERFEKAVEQVFAARNYFEKLEELTARDPLESYASRKNQLTEEIAGNSEELWKTWLALQPARLSQADRKLLGDYSSILQMIVAANDENRKLGREVFRKYYALFPRITSIMSCWAVTSLSARGRIPFEPNFFDLLVIDEASQCDIASALPLLFRSKRAVIIGDPMQLRHISTLTKYQDQQLLNKHELLAEYPGWSYSSRSLFDLASSLCRSEDIVVLRDHHRSHADIIQFSNEAFYEGRLRVATKYDRLRPPPGELPAIRWVDVQGKARRPGSGGAINEMEAEAVVSEIERLVSQGYHGSIGVVSPFRAQANRIRDMVFGHTELASRIGAAEFLADTVHKFQGDERDVMIFSPVVSQGIGDGALNFLRNNPNLFNVAVTRARACLIVVGNKAAILDSRVDYLASFASYSDQVVKRRSHTYLREVQDLGAEYPVVSNSDRVSEWERILYRALYRDGLRSIPQYQVEKYTLDLAVISGSRKLDIEVDGERYHRNWDGELCRRDQIRNQRLIELGWDVMRFWVYQIRDDIDRCVSRVRLWRDNAS